MSNYTTTEAMKANQSKGRAWKNKKKKKDKDTTRSYESPYEMTSKSFDDDLTLDEVKELYGFLTKQKDKINKYNVDNDGLPTVDYIDWLDAGGNAALAWSTEILKSADVVKLNNNTTTEEKDEVEKGRFVDVEVCKSVNTELMQATYVVLEPQDGDYTDDLHGDTYTEDEVRKACHNFTRFCMKANLLHLVETDSFAFVESSVAPVDFVLGEQFVKKGSWLATIQVYDEDIWEMIKKGEFNGLSIQALAKTEYLEEADDE